MKSPIKNHQSKIINQKSLFYPEQVLIEAGCENLAYTRKILSRLPGVPVKILASLKEHLSRLEPDPSALDQGKKTLLLMKNRGKFLKPCPGTQKHLCCLYMVLHHAGGCPLDCTYCILQIYLNIPYIVYYVNVEDMISELREAFTKTRGRIIRLGTGEYTDSLALEHITRTGDLLIPLIKEFPDVFLEVKSKCTDTKMILGREPREQIIFAWSLNPDILIKKEEKGATSLDERLAAAKSAQNLGHPVAFHFDPLLRFPGWEDAYREVVIKMAKAVDLSKVFWVSIGSFRFPPAMKPIIEERFPDSNLLYEEFIRGEDGKMRYFKALRIEMYSKIVKWLRDAAPDIFIYFCMEREDVWDKVLGFHPENNLELKHLLDNRCKKI
jgi:DNA repair photolyase